MGTSIDCFDGSSADVDGSVEELGVAPRLLEASDGQADHASVGRGMQVNPQRWRCSTS
jgi:hypothetical protein